MKFTIAGDSHGPKIYGVLEGLPSGFEVSIEKIDQQLKRRQSGYGRGKRMELEHDRAYIQAGLWNGKTTGAPLVIELANKAPIAERTLRSVPRPGHVDYAAWSRYGLHDLAVYAERSSARWTAALVAVGSVVSQFLSSMDIKINSSVTAIGNANCEAPEGGDWIESRDSSPVFCHDSKTTLAMIAQIEKAGERGDTLGGRFTVVAQGVAAGTGRYGELLEKLDSKIGQYFMAIPSVKGVFIGNPNIQLWGSQYHDPFCVENKKVTRASNNAGGVEGGISNGEDIVVTASVKPIPTMRNGIGSVDLKTLAETRTPYVRSDITAVPAASVVGESMLALLLFEAIVERYGNGNFWLLKGRVDNESVPDWNDGLGEKHHR